MIQKISKPFQNDFCICVEPQIGLTPDGISHHKGFLLFINIKEIERI